MRRIRSYKELELVGECGRCARLSDAASLALEILEDSEQSANAGAESQGSWVFSFYAEEDKEFGYLERDKRKVPTSPGYIVEKWEGPYHQENDRVWISDKLMTTLADKAGVAHEDIGSQDMEDNDNPLFQQIRKTVKLRFRKKGALDKSAVKHYVSHELGEHAKIHSAINALRAIKGTT